MLTRSQIAKASADAQIAFCLDKQPTYEVALAREIEALMLSRIAELQETNALNNKVIDTQHRAMVNAEQRGVAKGIEESAERIAELERSLEFAQAVAAADNTLHHAVDVAQAKVVELEAKLAQQAEAQEPYEQVTTHSTTGQQFFYRWPQTPYLDNASECVTVFTRPQPASEPMTDEQAVRCIEAAGFKVWTSAHFRLVKEVERHHGIGVAK